MVPECDRDKPSVIEITERAMLRDRMALQRHLVSLLKHGFRIALDHLGSNYSSLLYLADFPVFFLKIEQQLRSRVAMLICDMARQDQDLGIITIAEGVGTTATAETPKELGINGEEGITISRCLSSPKPFERKPSGPFL